MIHIEILAHWQVEQNHYTLSARQTDGQPVHVDKAYKRHSFTRAGKTYTIIPVGRALTSKEARELFNSPGCQVIIRKPLPAQPGLL